MVRRRNLRQQIRQKKKKERIKQKSILVRVSEGVGYGWAEFQKKQFELIGLCVFGGMNMCVMNITLLNNCDGTINISQFLINRLA